MKTLDRCSTEFDAEIDKMREMLTERGAKPQEALHIEMVTILGDIAKSLRYLIELHR